VAERLFILQQKLESWIEEGAVTFDNNLLTLLAEKLSYTVEPAVRILSVIDGQDNDGLCGQALTVAEIVAKKGEHYRDSVIFGDTAYQCEEGFIGTAQGKPLVVARPVTPLPRPAALVAKATVPDRVQVATPVLPPPAPKTAAPKPIAPVPPPAQTPTVVPVPPVSAPVGATGATEGDNSADLLAAFMLKHM